jgi:hypothetical protein
MNLCEALRARETEDTTTPKATLLFAVTPIADPNPIGLNESKAYFKIPIFK